MKLRTELFVLVSKEREREEDPIENKKRGFCSSIMLTVMYSVREREKEKKEI